MDANSLVGLVSVAALLALLFVRVPIAVAMTAVSIGGLAYLAGFPIAWSLLQTVPYTTVGTWTFSSVPMFLLMGYVCFHAGITTGLFRAANWLFGRLPGGLAIAAIFGCAGFSAVTGSSVACAAAMGRVAIPEMTRQKYDISLAAGTLAAAGTIGALIPPSIIMILYGTIAQVSVVKLFQGGLLVGLMTAILYIVVVLLRIWFNPALAPRRDDRDELGANVLLETWPVILLIVCVFGGLFSGIFTPTEAGGVGATVSILIAAAQGRLNLTVLRKSIIETAVTTSAIMIIAIAASLFTKLMALSGLSSFLEAQVTSLGLDPILVMTVITLIYLLLGCFMEPLGAMLITLPIFIPIVQELGYSLIWFGVLVTKFLEVGMVTPPIGMNVFVIKSVVGSDVPIGKIFRGIFWFFVADIFLIAICSIWPEIVLVATK